MATRRAAQCLGDDLGGLHAAEPGRGLGAARGDPVSLAAVAAADVEPARLRPVPAGTGQGGVVDPRGAPGGVGGSRPDWESNRAVVAVAASETGARLIDPGDRNQANPPRRRPGRGAAAPTSDLPARLRGGGATAAIRSRASARSRAAAGAERARPIRPGGPDARLGGAGARTAGAIRLDPTHHVCRACCGRPGPSTRRPCQSTSTGSDGRRDSVAGPAGGHALVRLRRSGDCCGRECSSRRGWSRP